MAMSSWGASSAIQDNGRGVLRVALNFWIRIRWVTPRLRPYELWIAGTAEPATTAHCHAGLQCLCSKRTRRRSAIGHSSHKLKPRFGGAFSRGARSHSPARQSASARGRREHRGAYTFIDLQTPGQVIGHHDRACHHHEHRRRGQYQANRSERIPVGHPRLQISGDIASLLSDLTRPRPMRSPGPKCGRWRPLNGAVSRDQLAATALAGLAALRGSG
jgi:hypothetical protein